MNMPYNSLNATKDNLKYNTDLDLNSLKYKAELDCDLTTLNNNTRNKISFLLLLAAAYSTSS